ncbi:hypothetical protein BIV23_28015 [Streptomyces monashensis]|uniref:Uncharacterized protein n=1 Tax=Streptomyces monashensis TaxID=1678012 RepID=A0A1S2Q2J6_9ACTN|nr:hypothetical protein BIV23_28015 [Streptomyces monashensis]
MSPAHGGGIETGQQRSRRLGSGRGGLGGVVVFRQEIAGAFVEFDGLRAGAGQGLAGVGETPAGPPLHVIDGDRTERLEIAAGQAVLASATAMRMRGRAEVQRNGAGAQELAGRERRIRPSAASTARTWEPVRCRGW